MNKNRRRGSMRKRKEKWTVETGSHNGFYWLAGYFGADAKGEIDNGHGCVRYGRLTSYPVHSSRDREKKRWPAASLTRWMASSFLVQPGWLDPVYPLQFLFQTNVDISHVNRLLSLFFPSLFFFFFFSFTSTLFLRYARFSFLFLEIYSLISPNNGEYKALFIFKHCNFDWIFRDFSF